MISAQGAAVAIVRMHYYTFADSEHSLTLACHRKNGPGKNGSAGPILDEKMVRPDQYWPTKYGLAGPILVTKSGPV